MRTSDPVRTRVGEAVQQQVRLADEGVRVLLQQTVSEMQTETQAENKSEQEVLELLRVADLANAEALEALLERSVQDKEWKRKMCEVLECEDNELLEETQQIKCMIKKQENLIESLTKQIDEKELQVNELTKKVESMEHATENGQQGQLNREAKRLRFRVLTEPEQRNAHIIFRHCHRRIVQEHRFLHAAPDRHAEATRKKRGTYVGHRYANADV